MEVLKLPYPFYHRGRELLRITLTVLIVGFLFEYFIIPFERNPKEHLYSYEIITLFHIGVATLSYFLFFLVLSQFVKEDEWKVYKEVLSIFCLLVIIGIGEWSIRPLIYDQGGHMSWYTFFEEIWHALLAGSMIYLLVLINLAILTRRHSLRLQQFHLSDAQEDENNESILPIKTQNLSDDFEMNPNNMICAKADGNYLELYLKDEEEVKVLIKRLTLQSLDEQLKQVASIVKTHRAFLVNRNYIVSVRGNAQGYLLEVSLVDFPVPVSRKHITTFEKMVS